MTVQQQGLVTGVAQQHVGIAEFQRQVWFAAAEIDTAVKGPGWVDQCDPHARALPLTRRALTTGSPRSADSHSARSRNPSRQPMRGFHPRDAVSRPVSATK